MTELQKQLAAEGIGCLVGTWFCPVCGKGPLLLAIPEDTELKKACGQFQDMLNQIKEHVADCYAENR